MIGIDIVNIKRIENLLEKKNFLDRFFTENEQEYLESRHFRHESIAGLIAAKESVAKAFQVGIGKELSFTDIEILHDENNAPYVNAESSKVYKIMKEKSITKVNVNISHDGDYATAVCNLNKIDDFGFTEKLLPKRDENSNKYDFGKVLIIGGSKGMTGSVVLSSEAALRSGAGLVYLLVPDSLTEIVEIKTTEQIILSIHDEGYGEFGRFNREELLNVIQNKTVVAIGPGLGVSEHTKEIVEIVLNNFEGPVVLDADAINILALYPELMRENLYLTPHVMEFSRLSNYTLNEIEYDRIGSVKNYIDRFDINLILKGKDSIVANRFETFINPTGNSGMATAGSGDVLTGIVAALLAKENSFEMFKIACYVHGLAGDYAAKKYGKTSMIARDIIEQLPIAFGETNEA